MRAGDSRLSLCPLPGNDTSEVAQFAGALSRISWFAAVGQALKGGEARDGRAYLRALGFSDGELHAVSTWQEAERITRAPDWNQAWWDGEERLRLSLLEDLYKALGQHPTWSALTRVTDEATKVTLEAAAVAAARDGIADPALTRVAAGAASQAAYQAALARMAGAGEDHAFAAKFRLFAAGRWPLGLIGSTFYVF